MTINRRMRPRATTPCPQCNRDISNSNYARHIAVCLGEKIQLRTQAYVRYDWTKIQHDIDNGLSYREIAQKYSMTQQSIANAKKRGAIKTRTLSEANIQRFERDGPNVMSIAARSALSKRMSENNPGGRSKWFEVAGKKVQGTWERDFALYLEENGVEWQRGHPMVYVLDGKEKHYTPDFYLPQFDRYVEVKGYWWGDDRRKMQAVIEQHQDKNFVVIESKDFSTITGLW